MRCYPTDTIPDLRSLWDLDESLEIGVIRAQLGYTQPPALLQLPAVEDTERLVNDVRRRVA